ncbi:homocysteine S-methyltransferase family protein [candidate division CSSED10-310 bacterium]|uniref:Homocysteine S-methyltransferase family protein n=1 Tax=candidate division CSSED10-310 bacterium TaxID=2855610 RepID=A0ABV6Z1C8_UNCC1
MDFLKLIADRVVLFDGAMGSMLFASGLQGGDCPEEWNITHPETITHIHDSYYKAGSDVVETNSFGGSSLKLASYGFADKAVELNEKAAQLAKKVAPPNSFVAGSVGPCGQFIKPLGDLDEETLYESFKEQICALVNGGADIICIETMMDITEATIAVRAAKENTTAPVIATMTFSATPRGYFTMMGVDPNTAAQKLVKGGADVVGANCGNGPHEMVELIPAFAAAVDAPLLFQSNAGLPKLVDGNTVYDMGPQEYAAFIPDFLKAGAGLIGGCCGTTPEHMSQIKKLLQELRR